MFEIKYYDKNTKARAGVLKTNHGIIKTPFFMPVVTKGSAKYLTFKDLEDTKTQVFISNAYLLYLKPGFDFLKKNDYHKFINWNKPIFTDSGGFQLKDPDFLIKLTDDGVFFKDPFSGDKHFISPQKLIDLQNTINSDIAMVLDDMRGAKLKKEEYKEAVDRTIKWAKIAKESHKNKNQLLFGIVQGGIYKDLREKCAKEINKLDFDGIAIGGLAIGESKDNMYNAIDYSLKYLNPEKIKYLMGLGSPKDIVYSISKGVDCFDSIYPTKSARHGGFLTDQGLINIKKSMFREDFTPLDENCDCFACITHTKAYIHHLFRVNEPNYKILLSIHNIRYMQRLMERIRKEIEKGSFLDFQKTFLENFKH